MPPPPRRRTRYDSAKYNGPHRVMRQRLDRVVQTGTVACVRCGELIEPGTEWHLDHRDDGRGWLGPSHAKCNQRAGWEKMVASANGSRLGSGKRIDLEERPSKWSQRWSEDPPPGTTVNISGSPGFVELYVGNGVWQTVRRSDVGD